jgi:hypothetical protein
MGKSFYQSSTDAGLKLCRRLIFDNFSNPFTQALAVTTRLLVPTAIFNSAEQHPSGLQSAFDLPRGFLDFTTTLYVSITVSAL